MSSSELTEWALLYEIKAHESELRRQGHSEDEIATLIESPSRGEDTAESALLEAMLGETMKTERYLRRMESVRDLEDEDEGDDGG